MNYIFICGAIGEGMSLFDIIWLFILFYWYISIPAIIIIVALVVLIVKSKAKKDKYNPIGLSAPEVVKNATKDNLSINNKK